MVELVQAESPASAEGPLTFSSGSALRSPLKHWYTPGVAAGNVSPADTPFTALAVVVPVTICAW